MPELPSGNPSADVQNVGKLREPGVSKLPWTLPSLRIWICGTDEEVSVGVANEGHISKWKLAKCSSSMAVSLRMPFWMSSAITPQCPSTGLKSVPDRRRNRLISFLRFLDWDSIEYISLAPEHIILLAQPTLLGCRLFGRWSPYVPKPKVVKQYDRTGIVHKCWTLNLQHSGVM